MDRIDAYLAKVQETLDSAMATKYLYVEPETKGRVVKDPSYWNADPGTPITLGMKPVTRSADTAIARGKASNVPIDIEVEGGMFVTGMKWDDVPIEVKQAIADIEDAGTHYWGEDPQYEGVVGFVEKGTMKALVVVYPDGTFDMDAEFKTRHVRDVAYWGMPYGTPIEPGMKPAGPKAVGANGPKA